MKDLSLYIHIPFCKTICLYCNFLTFAHKNRWIPQYIEALIKEIEARAKQYQNYQIETIYFGGGTPSLIEAIYIEEILQKIFTHFQLVKKPEISIECNPESIDTAKLTHYKKAGVTRFSLGIQSFNKKTLLRIARPHDHLTIYKALDAFKNAGIKNFGADFIMGLPYQTLESFKEELQTILSYKPPHLSFYFLSYDTKRIDIFKADCPGEELEIKMYEHLIKTLKHEGYNHYEVSNYAKPGFECQHNLRYWEQKDYLGLGLGAHSIIKNNMWENQSDFDAYLRDPLPTTNEMPIDPDLKRMEYIMLRLRTSQGIDLTQYKTFGDEKSLLAKAKSFISTKHLHLKGDKLTATEKGYLVTDFLVKSLL